MRHVDPFRLAALLAAFVLALPSPGQAHRPNESYVYFNVTEDSLAGRVEMTPAEMDRLVPLDADSDGTVTEAEVLAGAEAVFAYLAQHVRIAAGGTTHPIVGDRVSFLGKNNSVWAQYRFTVPGLSSVPAAVEVTYAIPVEAIAPGHRGHALIESNTRTGVEENESMIAVSFAPGAETRVLDLAGEPLSALFGDYLNHGLWRVWLGPEHLLTLLVLIATAVAIPAGTRAAGPGATGMGLAGLVAVWVAATLAGALLTGVVGSPLSGRTIEAAVPVAAALLALGSFVAAARRFRWVAVAGLGLVQGLGMAGLVATAGTDPVRVGTALSGFGLGSLLAGLAVVAILLPPLLALRDWRPVRVLTSAGVVLLAVAAAGWYAERVYDVLGPVRASLIG
jgi:hypothetical protein